MNIEKYAKICLACDNLCQFVCPVFNSEKNQIYAPGEKLSHFLYAVQKDDWNFISELSYACIDCKSCYKFCNHKVNVGFILHFIRNNLITKDFLPENLKDFEANYYKNNDSLYKNFDSLKIIEYFDLNYYKKNNLNTVFIPDVELLKYFPENIAKLFDKFDNISLYTEKISNFCEFYDSGYIDEFITDLKQFIKTLRKYDLIVVESVNLYFVLKYLTKKFKLNFKKRVVSIIEYCREFIDDFKKENKKAIYLNNPKLKHYIKRDEKIKILLNYVFNNLFDENIDLNNFYLTGSESLLQITHDDISKNMLNNIKTVVEKNSIEIIIVNDSLTKQYLSKNIENIEILSFIDVIIKYY